MFNSCYDDFVVSVSHVSGDEDIGATGPYISEVCHQLQHGSTAVRRGNRCTDDAVAVALHFVMQFLEFPNRYASILLLDYSSAFNTVIELFGKLHQLSLHSTMCYCLLEFLLQRSQVVKINGIVSSTIILNTGTPQGCVLSPLLYSLFTNVCFPSLLRITFKVRR